MPGLSIGIARRRKRRAGLAVLAAALVAIACGAALARSQSPQGESAIPVHLFGAAETAHPPATDFAKWTDAIRRYEAERATERTACESGDCALKNWRDFLATLEGKDPQTQLRAVNAYFNRIPYRTDLDNYGVEDYWATPRELFAKGGDCEDYALAKYLSLRVLGWPAERLRIAVVQDNARDLVHAALIAYEGGEAYLLDIEFPAVMRQIEVTRYAPIFAISENGWWSYAAPVAVAKSADGAEQAKGAARRIVEARSVEE